MHWDDPGGWDGQFIVLIVSAGERRAQKVVGLRRAGQSHKVTKRVCRLSLDGFRG